MHPETLKELCETSDPYVAVAIARSAVHSMLSDALKVRMKEFGTIQKVLGPCPSKLIELAETLRMINKDLAERLARVETIFADRNTKVLDLESKDQFSGLDHSKLAEHPGFIISESDHVFKVWLIFTINELLDKINYPDYENPDEW